QPLHATVARPRPGRPPFPYPTLFRSAVGVDDDRVGRGVVGIGLEPRFEPAAERGLALGIERIVRRAVRLLGPRVEQGDRLAVQPDRKSTRLNSSHVKSSYAVFCVQKK